MNRTITLTLLVFSIAIMTGCTDTESIPSDDIYTSIAEKKMPYYCKHKIAKEFGIYSEDIYLYPVVYERGAKIIRGRYRLNSNHLYEFACIFNNNDTFAGIKMNNANVRNELCYGQ